jgi:hypothetical protein
MEYSLQFLKIEVDFVVTKVKHEAHCRRKHCRVVAAQLQHLSPAPPRCRGQRSGIKV